MMFSSIYHSIQFIVYRMECDKTKWSCLWNSDQNTARLTFLFCLKLGHVQLFPVISLQDLQEKSAVESTCIFCVNGVNCPGN